MCILTVDTVELLTVIGLRPLFAYWLSARSWSRLLEAGHLSITNPVPFHVAASILKLAKT